MEKCIHYFSKEILPLFEVIKSEEELLQFIKDFQMKQYGRILLKSNEILYINLHLRNYAEALEIVEAYRNHRISTLSEKYSVNEHDIPDSLFHFNPEKNLK